MRGLRVMLIGGTSNSGKSTIAQEIADRRGFECMSTDGLARHPGRPWRTRGQEVPAHVVEHYESLTTDELITSVLDHYERLWPHVEELVATHAVECAARPGLVLEGSALWPASVVNLTTPNTAAVWLTADDAVLRSRVRTAGSYDDATDRERHLMDKFLARLLRYQALMLDAVTGLGLDYIDVSSNRSVSELADSVLAFADAQHSVGRS